MRSGLDYAAARPGGSAIRAAGYDFVVRYLSDGGPALPGKLLTPDEAADLRAHGVSIVSNWETTADRMLDGHDAGVADARLALRQALACGGRADRPVYFSADFDATPEQQTPIDAYLDGAASVLGRANVGIYGGYWPVSRALDAGAAVWAWQTDAWSGGHVETRRQLHQTTRQVTVNGVVCDVDEAETADFGQWDHTAAAETFAAAQDGLLRDIRVQVAELLAQFSELRTEIGDLETTIADLRHEVQRLSHPQWPWPLSLLGGPAHAIAEQLARLDGRQPLSGARHSNGERAQEWR
ncbi:DUF1906 domain-containing protein [Nocardia terpenica]|uniref:Rv2525c-like glycoside hydrolase-like domain-containing protein n=1 Tax=Nocardia terpenica TaxID=455432 RepID=A0A164JPC4_9NOCA|nr:DUF1906 domain-containing protein [Nocardia terpenica]KZM70595.1 hypothetical protein AWN90_39125 [Nocardia terpenica]NQE90158.1 DUF1906 domain-containing protein [Nocardia terpenica]